MWVVLAGRTSKPCSSWVRRNVSHHLREETSRLQLHLNIRHPDNHILELVVFPSIDRSFDHSEGGIVLEYASADGHPPSVTPTHKLIIFDEQQDEFWPEMSLLCRPDDLGDVDTSDEELQVLHH